MAITEKEYLDLKARLTNIETNAFREKQAADASVSTLNDLSDQVRKVVKYVEDTKAELVDMIKQVGGQHAQPGDLVNRIAKACQDLEQKVNALERQAPLGTASTSTTSKSVDLLGSKVITTLTAYSGDSSKYHTWACKLKGALRKHDDLVTVLKWVEEQREQPTEKTLQDYIKSENIDEFDIDDLLDQFYDVLIFRTDGSAFHMIQGLEDVYLRGALSWWKLKQAAQGMTGDRLAGLHERISNPPKVDKISDLQASVDTWESWVREVERTEGTLKDYAKIAGFIKMLPASMHQYVVNHGFENFSELRRYVGRQIAMHRECFFGPPHVGKGPTLSKNAMDIGAFGWKQPEWNSTGPNDEWAEFASDQKVDEQTEETIHALKGQKGGFKGARFQGYCHGCGKWGHRHAECRSSFKGKEGAKGQWYPDPNQWYSKGYGKDFKGYSKGKDNKGYGKGKGSDASGKGKGGFAGSVEQDYVPTMCGALTSSPLPSTLPRDLGTPAYIVKISSRFDAIAPVDTEDSEEIPSVTALDAQWPPLKSSSDTSPTSTRRPRMEKTRKKQWAPFMESRLNQKSMEHMVGPSRSTTSDDAPADVLGALMDARCSPARAGPGSVDLHDPLSYLQDESGRICSLDGEWELMESLVDSGATACVMDSETGEGIPVEESLGSRRGQVYHAANGAKLPNKGQKVLSVVTEDWDKYKMTYQVADVVKPLTSVSNICDAADGLNTVTFTSKGGWIYHAEDNKYTTFHRENGVYLLRTWIRRPSRTADGSEPFARLGVV